MQSDMQESDMAMIRDMVKGMVGDMIKDAMDRMTTDMQGRYDGMIQELKDAMARDMPSKDMQEEKEEEMGMVSMDSLNQLVAERVGLISRVKPFLKDSAEIEVLEPRAICERFLSEQGFSVQDSHSDEYLRGRVEGMIESLQAKADRPSSTGSLRGVLSQAVSNTDQADVTSDGSIVAPPHRRHDSSYALSKRRS